MNDTILKIGDVDMTMHVICEAVDITETPVYSDVFTAVTGEDRKTCIGVKVDLSAEFSVLREEAARALKNACNADKVTVTYKCPGQTVTVFDRPVFRCAPVFEDGVTSYHNISLSMSCPLKGDGL